MTLINSQTNKPCLSGPSQSSSCFSLELLYFITLHSILSQISFSFWKSLWLSICCSLTWTVFSTLSLKMANSYTPNSAKERTEDVKSYIYWTLPRFKCFYHWMTMSTLNGTVLTCISLVRKLGTKEARNNDRSIWHQIWKVKSHTKLPLGTADCFLIHPRDIFSISRVWSRMKDHLHSTISFRFQVFLLFPLIINLF